MDERLLKSLREILKKLTYADHQFKGSRREFVKLGLMTGGAALMPMGFLSRAFAHTPPTIPFLVFDLAGGAGLSANFLVGQKGGPEDLCENYRKMGWNPRANDSLDRTFGLPMSKNHSRLLAGLKVTLPKAIGDSENQKMLKMASVCHFSLDDTSTNQSSVVTLISKAGLRGSYSRSGLGMISSASGGNSDVLLRDAKFKPVAVRDAQDILKMTSFGVDYEAMPKRMRDEIFKLLRAASANSPEFIEIYENLSESGVIRPEMNVRNSKPVIDLYSQGGFLSPETELQASVVYNVLSGHTGPGVITIGGCDYHDNTQATGDNKDFEIGQAIGRAVHAAQILQKPLFFQIISDGSVYATESNNYERIWRGDANQHSISVFGMFKPHKNVENRRLQLGHFTPQGQIDMDNPIGKGPEKMVVSALATYLHMNGMAGSIEALTGIRVPDYELDEMLLFD